MGSFEIIVRSIELNIYLYFIPVYWFTVINTSESLTYHSLSCTTLVLCKALIRWYIFGDPQRVTLLVYGRFLSEYFGIFHPWVENIISHEVRLNHMRWAAMPGQTEMKLRRLENLKHLDIPFLESGILLLAIRDGSH